MTGINHAVTGAVIAAAIKQPVLAIPLAFASHYILDVIPHFGLTLNILERNRKRIFRTVLSMDVPATILALIFIPILASNVVPARLTLTCMVAAIGPDFAWVYRFIKETRTKKFIAPNKFNAFHAGIQWSETPWGLGVEVVYLGIASIILRSLL